MKKIVLSTINARYIHAAIGLRYLYANMNELQVDSEIIEFCQVDSTYEIVEKVLTDNPKIVGFGVYIWNATETSKVVQVLKKISPETTIILGGPEVSYLPHRVNFELADYIISGEGDVEFYNLCRSIIDGTLPKTRMISARLVDLENLKFPYDFYTDEDIANRVLYVEASRGCPFTCEFCLSSIDKSVRNFYLDNLLLEFDKLWERGARTFKFVDRTFNLNTKTTNQILDYFLSKEPPFVVHFEVVPEHFPESVKDKIKQFAVGTIQLEVGIQTLNPDTAENIKRKLNFDKIKKNLHFLETETNAHLHVDLIIGLPGENIESFGDNLNQLMSLTNSEVQLGVLKKLSGTELNRHDEKFGMVYTDLPPYEILKNDLIPYKQMQKMKRLARFWDLFYNSGNFYKTIRLLWETETVFSGFYNFSEWIYSKTEATWQISLNRQAELLFKYIYEEKDKSSSDAADMIIADLLKISGRKIPKSLRNHASHIPEVERQNLNKQQKRQMKHS